MKHHSKEWRETTCNVKNRTMRCASIRFLSAIALSSMLLPAIAGNVIFPQGAVINITDPRYCYNSSNPATALTAIQNAISESLYGHGPLSVYGGTGQYVYLPNGVYVIDKQLMAVDPNGVWMHGLTLVGQSREGTIIRLKDNSPGFTDPGSPKGMIKFSGSQSDGTGNSGFNNFVLNMTIDVGKGNPGACGIDFIGNNVSGIQNVSIISQPNAEGKRQGFAGIDMSRPWTGPGLIKNVSIDGFDFGIDYGQTRLGELAYLEGTHNTTSMTLENVTLRSQNIYGIRTYQSMLTIRGLLSNNTQPVLKILKESGIAFILDAELYGGDPGKSAIQSAKNIYLRNVKTTGYQTALAINDQPVFGKSHVEFSSSSIKSMNVSPAKSLGLPILETPEYWDEDTTHWANMPKPDTIIGVDDAVAIRNALSAIASTNRTTIWFPRGAYTINSTISIPSKIKHVVGVGTTFVPGPDISESNPILSIADTSTVLRLEHLIFGRDVVSSPGVVCIAHKTSRTIALSQVYFTDQSNQGTAYQSIPGSGNVFLENVGGSGMAKWTFSRGQKVWARQFNIEGQDFMIKNLGADLWILGLKTEKTGVVIETNNQGRTELFGGCLKPTFNKPNAPAFLNIESSVSLGYMDSPVQDSLCPNSPRSSACSYPIQIREKRNGIVTDLLEPNGESLWDGAVSFGSMCPLYVGYPVLKHPSLVRSPIPLLMDKTEVTQDDYQLVMSSHTASNANPSTINNPTYPVQSITYFDAILYSNYRSEKEGLDKVYSFSSSNIDATGKCVGLAGLAQDLKKNGYRLPTEAEWTIAYRAGTTTPNYWGSQETSLFAWYSANTGSYSTKSVGQKRPNSLGLFDMAGNVSEWVWSDVSSGGIAMGGFYSSTGDSELSGTFKITSLKTAGSSSTGFRVVRLAPSLFSQSIQPLIFQ